MDGRIIREILGWYVERGGTTKETAYSDEKCKPTSLSAKV